MHNFIPSFFYGGSKKLGELSEVITSVTSDPDHHRSWFAGTVC